MIPCIVSVTDANYTDSHICGVFESYEKAFEAILYEVRENLGCEDEPIIKEINENETWEIQFPETEDFYASTYLIIAYNLNEWLY